MKKYLFLAVAALGLAACAEKGLDNNGPANNGELEQSYVAITLAADDMNTKAGTNADGSAGVYADGSYAERQVESAHVFFFYDNGNAFPVTANGENYVSVHEGFNELTPDNVNVSDIQNAVLVIQNRKGEHPTKMIAVLNWVPSTNYSISELQTTLSDLGNETAGFIMSNAVYAQNGVEMSASIITPENIAETAQLAKTHPVKIYVERLAAKVTFDASNNGMFPVGYLNNDEKPENAVSAKITGWELYKDYSQSTYVKDINPSWTDLGFNWNDPDWNRSYWTLSDVAEKDGAFASTNFRWKSTDGEDLGLKDYFYCGENANRTEADRTKVIIKAQLLDADGDAIELARWHSTDYVGDVALKTAVANTLKYSIYSGVTNGGTTEYTSLLPGDLTIVEANPSVVADIKAFEVYFQLSLAGTDKTWYEYKDGQYTEATDDEINARLALVQPALKYENGQTYYYTDIKHLGAEGTKGEYGVVRNHVYQFNIADINGYGTPVFNPETDFVTPERPKDVETFVAAEINILTWRVVEQNNTLN